MIEVYIQNGHTYIHTYIHVFIVYIKKNENGDNDDDKFYTVSMTEWTTYVSLGGVFRLKY